ncbi:M23 family metallopeptidase [Tsukamurella sp. 8F]|uniref:M23 family metallopeptidase n=1 Tax=unclassified Tsukamurella TaxID=2633480 RepID=UPI0023B95AAD|nr:MULTISPECIES: M23 family metallopeptidase [unclassified Tsukamurella]MDF0528930.1 M23 family metallopeptidase [Tsukamurella sp. 8J]MDF0589469.1 M23 family metallopeptidase [Tsukamurella sp. 8F]
MRPKILILLFLLGCAPLSCAAPAAAAAYAWPLRPRPHVAREFSAPAQRWERGHRGVDLEAAAGQTVYAAGPGTVHFVGIVDGTMVASVLHPNGLLTTYEPLAAPAVAVGDTVDAGSPLAAVAAGHPGCPVEACLHWGLRRGSGHAAHYFDPRLLIGSAPVRLLPLGGDPPES